jgi:hypothetical protein
MTPQRILRAEFRFKSRELRHLGAGFATLHFMLWIISYCPKGDGRVKAARAESDADVIRQYSRASAAPQGRAIYPTKTRSEPCEIGPVGSQRLV